MDAPSPVEADRIVLLWVGRLGDLLVATPLMAGLRGRFPSARIVLVTGERGETAARLIPGVDEVRVLRRFYRPMRNLELVLRLIEEPADLLVDLNSSWSRASWCLAALAKAGLKAAFSKGTGDRVFDLLAEAPAEDEHMLSRYKRLAELLGTPYEPRMRVRVTDGDRAAAEKVVRWLKVSSGSSLVGIFPGNFKKYENRWPEDKFAELTGRLQASKTLALYYLAGPGERQHVKRIASRLRSPVPVVGPLPLGTTAALLERTDLLVSNATGTAHLAVAVGTPTFTILNRYTKTVWMYDEHGGVEHHSVVTDTWGSCREIGVDPAYKALSAALEKLK